MVTTAAIYTEIRNTNEIRKLIKQQQARESNKPTKSKSWLPRTYLLSETMWYITNIRLEELKYSN
jgi:hypothetical protein